MSTQIILTATIDKLGGQGDTIAVADGYARNYLLPQGKAILATKGNLRRIEELKKRRAEELAAELEQAKNAAKKLAKMTITIAREAGQDGRLFGSVTAADISDALRAQGIEVDRKKIVLEHPLRVVGEHEVEIKLHAEAPVQLKVSVVSSDDAKKAEQTAERTSAKAQKAKKK
jgi:large subunit ribosomal protein L9